MLYTLEYLTIATGDLPKLYPRLKSLSLCGEGVLEASWFTVPEFIVDSFSEPLFLKRQIQILTELSHININTWVSFMNQDPGTTNYKGKFKFQLPGICDRNILSL